MEQEKAAALVEENMKTIFAYALSRISPREDAEDLAGDIILAILQSAPKIRDDNAFFAYIWAIAANTYKKFLRKRHRARCDALEEDTASEEDFTREIFQAAEFNTLRRELALLSREYRECTVAYYFDGLSCAQTSSKLHISLEMVKYYLFKTRKILKEGICMEREFGTKSYQPAPFELCTIYAGRYNAEYHNLFHRKLPGNILVSTYYTPMTIRELAIELGVAAVYLEDEIALLEKYRLLTNLGGGKYQASLVIFTESYMEEFYRTAENPCQESLRPILQAVRDKLPKLREIGFTGAELEDDILLWALLFSLMLKGNECYQASRTDGTAQRELYHGALGTNYGTDYIPPKDSEYECFSFAGYYGMKKGLALAASFADFNILPERNRFLTNAEQIKSSLDDLLAGKQAPAIPIVTQDERNAIERILQPEIQAVGRLYESLHRIAAQIMRVHAPKHILSDTDRIVAETLLFRTVGFLGACAVKSGALSIPDTSLTLGAILYWTEDGTAKCNA